ncbi:hypothetical protein [Methylobacterium sp. WL19]|uniref:hypothetical protein n=1 Tax=Methylobacterium sp. WL19 TaxID=2603896 RepID=UPI0011C8BA23|nr:hypothetical protein [Methylobacterium sp. WL19]TXN20601.1 hypothetical protein FV220_23925 [Methylobacterium sp. WL19]
MLATKSESLTAIIARISPDVDHEEFLRRFSIEFGPSVQDLQKSVIEALIQKGFSADDINAVVFPNAIQRIVDLATQLTVSDRTVEPETFLAALKDVRRVAFTRWTRELTTRAQIFKRLREDLKPSLAQNARARTFIIEPSNIENFDNRIILFIKNFVERYSCKYLHSDPPLFIIAGAYDVGALQARLYVAGLRCERGMVGETTVVAKELFRTPLIKRQPFKIEFSLRLANRNDLNEVPEKRPDDLFLVNISNDTWEHPDINVHKFEIECLSDLEYALQLRNNYA